MVVSPLEEGRINKVSDVLTSEAKAEIHGACRDAEVGRKRFFFEIRVYGQMVKPPGLDRERGNSVQEAESRPSCTE